jgi:non-lysosomal glucosylceramidase
VTSPDWPVLRTYDAAHLDRISLPLGGIGTGTVGLGGRGDLRDFELGNRPGKGFRPEWAFFAVRAESDDRPAQALAVEGPVPVGAYEGAFGSIAPHHGLPRFGECRFDAAYPLGQVGLRDESFPLELTLQGFNPLVLTDAEISSIPVAVLRHRITNVTSSEIRATVAFALSNFIGANGTEDEVGGNRNTFRRADRIAGVTLSAPSLSATAEAAGELTMSVLIPEGSAVSHRTGWDDRRWGNPILDFWDDLMEDGQLSDRTSEALRPVASLASTVTVPANGSVDVTFLLTWRFPNRRAWRSEEYGGINVGEYSDDIVGNAYARRYLDSWQTAVDLVDRLDELERATVETVRAVVESDTPIEIRESALFNLSTLRSPTVFQTEDGEYYGWEGVGDREGSCYGTCTHVWGYEFATSLLFPQIARSFRRTQYARCTDERGLMSFRAGLPAPQYSQTWDLAAADGQMACLVHLYLDWRLSGDDGLLTELWPAARRTLEFCWIPGGWDADRDGVMEGVQHNTMDVEYYGPNPQMGAWYLAALRAAEEMAAAVGDNDFAHSCRALFGSGSQWLDEHLFNGSYYRHEVRPVIDDKDIAAGLRHRSMGASSTAEPDLQLADGCLVDQLVGQYAATLSGLGDLLDPGHVDTALRSVFRRNFQRSFTHHFNHMRSFVLGDEAAVLMCSYDQGKRPVRPFPYFSEAMTGFEYTAATGLLQVGAIAEALEIIAAIRNRYDGERRNPFDEAECGHHYARALASWSAFVTWNDIDYDGRTQTMIIGERAPEGQAFWSSGSAFGTWLPRADSDTRGVLRVLRGELPLSGLTVDGDTHHPPWAVLTSDSPWAVPAGMPPP